MGRTVFWVLILTLVATSFALKTRDRLSEVWIEQKESSNIDLDQYFEGYNLSFAVSKNTPATWVSVTPKSERIATKEISTTTVFQAVAIETRKNGDWRTEMAAIDSTNNIYFGTLSSYSSLPDLTNPWKFEDDPTVTCFDIVRLELHTYLVDCIKIRTNEDYDNVFYLIMGAKDEVEPSAVKIPNLNFAQVPMPFDRKLELLISGGTTFVARFIKADSVSREAAQNSFIEIFRADDPFNPFLYDVIGKDELNLPTLTVNDLKVHNDEIYIADTDHGVLRLKGVSSSGQYPFFRYYMFDKTVRKLSLLPEEQYGKFRLIVLVGSLEGLYEIDWTFAESPYLRISYNLGGYDLLLSLEISRDFIYSKTNKRDLGTNFVHVLRRDSPSIVNTYYTFEYPDVVSTVDLYNKITQNVLVMGNGEINNYQFGKSGLRVIGQQQVGDYDIALDIYENLTLISSASLRFHIVETGSRKIFQKSAFEVPAYLNAPGTALNRILDNFIGPALKFIPEGDNLNAQVYKLNQMRMNIRTSAGGWRDIDPQTTIFMEFVRAPADSPYEGLYILFIQTTDLTLTYYQCEERNGNVEDVYCESLADIPLQGQVVNLLLTKNYIVVKTKESPLVVKLYFYGEFGTNKFIVFTNPLDECTDIDVASTNAFEYLYCTQPGRDTILLYDLALSTDVFYKIQRDALGIKDYFKPQEVYISSVYSNLLFIKDYNRILAISVSLAAEKFAIVLQTYSSEALKGDPEAIRFASAGNYLLVLNQVKGIIEEFDMTNPLKLFLRKSYTLLDFGFEFNSRYFYDYSTVSNFVYMQGYWIDPAQTKRSAVLIFRTGEPANGYFFDYIRLQEAYEPTFVQVTPGKAINSDVLFFMTPNAGGIYRVYYEPFVNYRVPLVDQTKQFEFNKIQFHVTTDVDQTQEADLNFDLAVWNSGNNITSTGQNAIGSVDVNSDGLTVTFDDSRSFKGAILGYNLDGCTNNECGDKIRVRPRIDFVKASFGLPSTDINDINYFGWQIHVLTSNSLWILCARNSDEVKNYVQIHNPSNDNFQCRRILVDDQGTYAIALCFDDVRHAAELNIISLQSARPTVIYTFYTSIQQFVDAYLLQEYLFIVDSDTSETPGSGQIRAYRIVLDGSGPEIVDEQVKVSAIDFGVDRIDASSFHVQVADKSRSTFLAIILDQNYGFRMLHLYPQGDSLQYDLFNVSLEYAFQQQLINHADVDFNGVRIIKNIAEGSSINSIVLVTARNFHSFVLSLIIDITKTTEDTKIELLKVFARYADYQHLPIVRTTDEQFILVAVNNRTQAGGSKLLLYDYHFDRVGQEDFYNQVSNALPIEYNPLIRADTVFEFARLPNDESKMWFVAFIGETSLREHRVYNETGITFSTQAVKTSSIHLRPFNEFTTSSLDIAVHGKGGSSPIGLILVLLLSAVIIVVVVVVVLQRRKKAQSLKSTVDPLLVNP
eukprot:TRINITY_DN4966_c0_g1_i4.p1 TRINITY_DN4966_c0_g1~~TRINITY_DN4966_c0_g1_i4.p1  ORF type:complete len:1452 (-),score=490.96 TRINITY_DN4966_c0_g1_i4:30-4385(-)